MPPQPYYRVSNLRGSLDSERDFWVCFLLCLIVMGGFFIYLGTRELMMAIEINEQRYARIEVSGGTGPVDQPIAEEPPAAKPVGKKKAPVVSRRKVVERREVATVNKAVTTRNQILKQSLVGVIATRSTDGNSALAKIFNQTGIGSQVDQALKKVDSGSVTGNLSQGGGGGPGQQSRGGGGGLGGQGVGIGNLKGVGTGFGGGKGEGVDLGYRTAHSVTAKLERGNATVEGALDAALIDQVVRKNLPGLKYCYEKELNRNPKLAGKIVVQFVIVMGGSVSDATVETSSIANPEIEDCLLRRIKRWRFPSPEGGSVIVSYPFVFTTTT